MSDELRQIATFGNALAAQLARARLEAEGIPAFLTNEHGSSAGGGVGLQVAESDVARARELLGASTPTRRSADGEPLTCLMCRSPELESMDWPLPLRLLRSLLLMAVPLPSEWFEGSRLRCRNCGYEQPAQAGPPPEPRP